MVETIVLNINEPCTFCGQNPPIGGSVPDISEGAKQGESKPCPVCLPSDYELCGDCGFDHDYEYEAAAAWHTAHPGSYPNESENIHQLVGHGVSKDNLRESLVQALIQHTGSEKHSRDLVMKIEQGRAWLFILYPDYMHDLAAKLTLAI